MAVRTISNHEPRSRVDQPLPGNASNAAPASSRRRITNSASNRRASAEWLELMLDFLGKRGKGGGGWAQRRKNGSG